MKIKITERGAHGPKDFVFEVGKVYELPKDMTAIPSYLVGKCIVIGNDAPAQVAAQDTGKAAINNPQLSEDELARQTRLVEISKALDADKHFTKQGLPDVAAVNALLDEGEGTFTAEERNKLWPSA